MRSGLLLLVLLLLVIPMLRAQQAPDLYDIDRIVEVKIKFSDANWQTKLNALKEANEDERLLADVWVNGKKYTQAGIRHKGNSSYYNIRKEGGGKLPFNVKVNFTDKKQKLPGGYTSLKLSNVFRDPSFLREVMAYEVASRYMPASRANFARVYVNDTYLGLYNLTQSVDDDLLEVFFGHDNGVLIKCDPNWHSAKMGNCPEGDKASLEYLGKDSLCYYSSYEIKSKHGGWADLLELIDVLNHRPEQLETILNIDEALWMLAFNNVTVNLDSYLGRLCHNYYLYRDTFGIFHPVIWDMNLSFGGFRYTGLGKPLTDETLRTMSIFLHYKEVNKRRPLILNLLRNDLYRKIYVAHVKTMTEEYFAGGKFKQRAEKLHAFIKQEVKKDTARLYGYADFERNLNQTVTVDGLEIPGLIGLMDERANYLTEHPLLQIAGPTLTDVQHKLADGQVTFSLRAEGAEQVWLFYRSATFHPWRRTNLAAGEDGSWTTQLTKEEVQEYYLVAEGEKVATVHPARASKEFLVVK